MASKIVIAKAKNVRGSAQKAKIPADVVRGMMVEQAMDILEYMPKKAAKDVQKVLASAAANATHNYEMDVENLRIKDIRVDKAMKIRRIKPKSRGMASVIHKHYSHITVELSDISDPLEESEKKPTSKKTEKASQNKGKVDAEVKPETKKTSQAKSKKSTKTKKSTVAKKAATKK
jgi:large subunit ribosomal protein L22